MSMVGNGSSIVESCGYCWQDWEAIIGLRPWYIIGRIVRQSFWFPGTSPVIGHGTSSVKATRV
jgi:hypothetical protein